MMLSKVWCLSILALLLFPCLISLSGPKSALAQSENLPDEDDIDEMEVEDDEEEEETVTVPDPADIGDGDDTAMEEDEEEEEEEDKIGPHPDAATILLFTNRQNNEFLAGEVVNSLIGFLSEGEVEFIVTGIEASLRYPQDFSYYIQNFTMDHYETYVMPLTQVSFVYSFTPSESFYARPFGLTVNVYYKDTEGVMYRDAVFNETINIVEVDEGFDGETFFMYVFMVSGISLLMFIIHYVYTTTVRKSTRSSKKPVETGTQGRDDIDYQWLPEGTLPVSPKKSPRASPRKARK